jgi:GNAT superfamily N-acetyltransferase
MPKKNWTIRKAVPADATELTACMQAAYMIYTPRMGGNSLPPMEVNYEEEIQSYPTYVAESDGVLVGGLILMPEEKYMTIANIAVHPNFQGHGLGRGLMEFGEKEAGRRGYSHLRMATHILLTENLALYSHLGWIESGRDENRIYMQKEND